MTTKILFMGTPHFAVPILQALLAEPSYDVVAVVTQPDRPVGRKHVLTPSPVKEAALTAALPVYQPEKLSGSTDLETLVNLKADLIITAAYGQFLPTKLLNSAQIAAINVHASLLPKYRGGAPIHYALLNGDSETGVTIMYMVKAMDAGDILAQTRLAIEPNETTGELFTKLSLLGRDLLLATLPKLITGQLTGQPQDEAAVVFAPNIKPEEEVLDFSQSAQAIHNHVRALNPFPIAHTKLQGVRTKIHKTHLVAEKTDLPAGTVVKKTKKELWLAAGDGHVLALDEVQPAGKAKMPIAAYLNGHAHFTEGDEVISDD